MGCDIHIYVEKKNEQGIWEVVKGRNPRIDTYRTYAKEDQEKGSTEQAERYEKDAAFIESGEALEQAKRKLEEWFPKKEREKDAEMMKEYEDEKINYLDYESPECINNWIYDGRNYDLFSVLADVRNGYGFAGVDTGDGFIPISEPKDLPNDVSPLVESRSERWGDDGHSHSYLTVKELLDYDWNQTTTHRGVVSERDYLVYKEKGKPESYSGSVGGAMVVHLTNEEMEQLINGSFHKEEGKSYYTQVAWKETYQESVGSFYTESLPKLQELAQDKLEDVRIVFWFDN